METLEYKGYKGSAEIDVESNVCHGKILFINDLVTYEARTPAALQKEFKAAVDDYVKTCLSIGKVPEKSFNGVFNVRVSPALHQAASLRAIKDKTKLNDVMVCALDAYLNAVTKTLPDNAVTVIYTSDKVGKFLTGNFEMTAISNALVSGNPELEPSNYAYPHH